MCLVLLVLKFTDEGRLSEISLNKMLLRLTGRFLNHRLFIFCNYFKYKKGHLNITIHALKFK